MHNRRESYRRSLRTVDIQRIIKLKRHAICEANPSKEALTELLKWYVKRPTVYLSKERDIADIDRYRVVVDDERSSSLWLIHEEFRAILLDREKIAATYTEMASLKTAGGKVAIGIVDAISEK